MTVKTGSSPPVDARLYRQDAIGWGRAVASLKALLSLNKFRPL